ncbi:hypothetical protein DL770_005922 [Monosporascus sp. CRB-9-2]|nr:hypothetical protein DL770_005922 [Monosporascus sp. CRB-9-2]
MAGGGEQCEIQICNVREKGTDVKYGLKNLPVSDTVSYALALERIYDKRNTVESAVIQVNSPHLLRIFKSLVRSYPAIPADYDVPFQMESPFQMLFHYWDELHATLLSNDIGDEERMHLKLLLGFMKAHVGPSKERVDSMLKAGAIAFSTLWTIFRPGCLVYTEVDSHPWLLRLEKTAYEENKSRGKFLELHCTYTDYDGQNYGLAARIIKIFQKTYFAAENPCQITKLPIFPLAWLKGGESIKKRLSERGAKFLGIHGVQVRAYHGLAQHLRDPPHDWYDPEMDEFPGVWLPHTETGRIVLDRKTFDEENHSESVPVSLVDVSEASSRILCPPYTYGFSLARKDWCRFYVDNISAIDWNKSALDDLVLSEERKSVLEALVFSHKFPEAGVRDEMKQKGKGLVVLLHGSPGSGKTLTAESVAELTEKALITATVGELNEYNIPYYFERRLEKLLQYATIWKAVVLLDEADVFLEGRSEVVGVAAEHNALVAVFLKHLEYFSGIVFLTSNRVMVFDKAMKSRIHLALEYKPPDLDMRRRIWTQCLSSIPAVEISLDIEEAVDEFLRDEVNGREIANCISTARTLAHFKGVKLGTQHVHTMLRTRMDFEKSLSSMRAKQKRDGPKAESYRIPRRDTLEFSND